MRKKSTILHLFLFVICLFISSGCNQTFQPRQENNKYFFSMYGYLDASADTQWVRITPARQDFELPSELSDVVVTLEHLESGQKTVMQDSLFSSRNYFNFWTTMDIENEQSYRIRAERSDGQSSQVTVHIPSELPTPLVYQNNEPLGYYVYIDDSIEHLADVQSRWYVLLNPQSEKQKRTYTFLYRNSAKHTTAYGGSYFALASIGEELEQIRNRVGNTEIKVLHRQFFVAAGGAEWDEEISTINDLEYFLDGTASNVENGLGYVVGIDSKWVPYETCLTPDKSAVVACPEEEPFW